MKYIIVILFSIFASQFAIAQNDKEPPIIMIGRSYNDHIVLRLFPRNYTALTIGNANGYVIEKATNTKGIAVDKLKYTPLLKSPFKKWTEAEAEKELQKVNAKDSNDSKLTGLAFGITDPMAKPAVGNVLDDGMESLKDRKESDDMKFMFVTIATSRSKVAAKVMSQWVDDEDTKLGQIYTYRVKLNKSDLADRNEWFYLTIECKNFVETYLKDDKAAKVIEGDKKITFSFPESREYFAFDIERSSDDKLTYQKITKVPSIKLKPAGIDTAIDFVFADSNLINYKKYYYRILVSTPFADQLILSEFAAIPRDKTPPPAPSLKSAIHINPKQVELIWDLNTVELKDLKGFNIKRSSDDSGPYVLISKKILPPASRKYLDEDFNLAGKNYYIVEAVDTARNISYSFPAYVTLIDSTPPAVPIIAKAIIDSFGKITITVKPNKERDFMGYQLLKANAREHEFSLIQQTYKDSSGSNNFILYDSTTLQSLTPKIYYQIIALDFNYNQSEPSEIIELKRPDTIPPVPPIIKDFKITDSTVLLTFANSGSEDVVVNFLLRREVGKEKFDTIFYNKDVNVTKFTDTKYTGGKQYEYTMIAKDDSKLASKKSRSIILKTLVKNELPDPIIMGIYDSKTKSIILNLKATQQSIPKNLKLEIYKSNAIEKDWIYWKTIESATANSIIDKNLAKGQMNFYMVRFINEAKVVSKFSKKLEVKIGDNL